MTRHQCGAPWDNTYPHSTFINMLTEMERALARKITAGHFGLRVHMAQERSQCAYALRKILEVPEENSVLTGTGTSRLKEN
jgi:hypothetical protein